LRCQIQENDGIAEQWRGREERNIKAEAGKRRKAEKQKSKKQRSRKAKKQGIRNKQNKTEKSQK
jgi:hypothetical protein